MGTPDRLILRGRLILRFTEDDNTCRLDVQSRTAGLDLRGKDRTCRGRLKCINDVLPLLYRNGAIDHADTLRTKDSTDLFQSIEEERKYKDLAGIFRGVLDDLTEALDFGGGIEVVLVSPGHAAHVHEGAVQYVVLVGALVLRRHVAPLLDVRQIRELREHALALSSVIDRTDLLLEVVGIGRHADLLGELGNIVLEVIHQVDHLADVVFERGARHEEHAVGVLAQGKHVLASLGGSVFDVMGFVDDDHVDLEVLIDLEMILEALVVRDGYAAFFRPGLKGGVAVTVVKVIRDQVALPFDFTAPVDDDAGRADNEEARRVRERGKLDVRVILERRARGGRRDFFWRGDRFNRSNGRGLFGRYGRWGRLGSLGRERRWGFGRDFGWRWGQLVDLGGGWLGGLGGGGSLFGFFGQFISQGDHGG